MKAVVLDSGAVTHLEPGKTVSIREPSEWLASSQVPLRHHLLDNRSLGRSAFLMLWVR